MHGIATVGLDNARAVGDTADVPLQTTPNQPGTINLVLACNALPDLSGKMEAVHMVTMATLDIEREAMAAWAFSSGIGQVGLLQPDALPPQRQRQLIADYLEKLRET